MWTERGEGVKNPEILWTSYKMRLDETDFIKPISKSIKEIHFPYLVGSVPWSNEFLLSEIDRSVILPEILHHYPAEAPAEAEANIVPRFCF